MARVSVPTAEERLAELCDSLDGTLDECIAAAASASSAPLSEAEREAWEKLARRWKRSVLGKVRGAISAGAPVAAIAAAAPPLMEPLDRELAERAEALDREVDELAVLVTEKRETASALIAVATSGARRALLTARVPANIRRFLPR